MAIHLESLIDISKKPLLRPWSLPFTKVHCCENRLCGDFVKIGRCSNGEYAFQVTGCLLTNASTRLLELMLVEKSISEAMNEFESQLQNRCFHGKLQVLNEVFQIPGREKCIVLPWECLRDFALGPV